MTPRFAVLTALTVAFGTTAAIAQTVVIQPEQETIIREYITTTPPPAPIDPGIDFDITVGSIVPETVEVYDLGAPDLQEDYDYVVIDNRTVVVEPDTRRIIHIIE